MTAEYANLIVDRHHQRVDQIYTYRIPEALRGRVRPGMMVSAPFGSGNRSIRCYVLEISESTSLPADKLKELNGLLSEEELFQADDVALARFLKERCGATLSSCLALFVPKKPETGLEFRTLVTLAEEEGKDKEKLRLGSRQEELLAFLRQTGGTAEWSVIRDALGISRSTLASLEKKGLILISEEPEEKPPASFISFEKEAPVSLNEEQEQALSAIVSSIREQRAERFLLFGITGSGKTEVYLRAAEETVRRGRQVILLVPEISLTPQYRRQLEERFGERVAVLHSQLTDAERSRRWERAKEGFYDVVVGPRSALFAPLRQLGLVIIDEEHETSYKAEDMPAYHAREAAEELCRIKGIPLVLGSATPSVESFYRAQKGELTLLRLSRRATGACLPLVSVADMRQEAAAGNMSLFSDKLKKALAERLRKGEQSILFLNRKGYAGFVNCRTCGFVLRCPRCYLPYTYHKDRNVLLCHHCGKAVAMPAACPDCGSPYIRAFGVGTQRVEEEVKRLFPEARVARMDRGTASAANAPEAFYRDMAEGRTDILIGTQMVAKGFDFPGVTLVGIVAADMTLFAPDYHATERTFQLLTQACGRSGRSGLDPVPGEAIIQTFAPEHFCIREAARQDYEAFYREELLSRELLEAPPFKHILQLSVTGKNEEAARREVRELYELMAPYAARRSFILLGPAPAVLGRINDTFRWKVLVKAADPDRLAAFGTYCTEKFLRTQRESVVSMDLDPAQLM